MYTSPLASILPLLSPRQTPDYQSYPPCAITCGEAGIDNANCPYTTEVAWTACLCKDASGQAEVAKCVYQSCGADTLNATGVVLLYNCQINGSPTTLTLEQFIADGEPAGTASVSASAITTTATDTAPAQTTSFTSTSNSGGSGAGGGSSGLNTASLIGTIVGSITGAIASSIVAYITWKKWRDKKGEGKNTGGGGAAGPNS